MISVAAIIYICVKFILSSRSVEKQKGAGGTAFG